MIAGTTPRITGRCGVEDWIEKKVADQEEGANTKISRVSSGLRFRLGETGICMPHNVCAATHFVGRSSLMPYMFLPYVSSDRKIFSIYNSLEELGKCREICRTTR